VAGSQIRDPRRPDFGGTVPILRAIFRVPPGCMAVHTFVPLFETFGLHYRTEAKFFSAFLALSFSTYNFALISDITIIKNNITRMICCGFVVNRRWSVGETIILSKILAQS
jgi:hypothetical protein